MPRHLFWAATLAGVFIVGAAVSVAGARRMMNRRPPTRRAVGRKRSYPTRPIQTSRCATAWSSVTWPSAESRTSACSTRSGRCPATSSFRQGHRRQAYDDESIPIGEGQTITPPYDVAFMTEVLDPKPTDVVYEVGTGSGYQSAILSRLVKEVYSVEIHKPLSERATKVHKEVGYKNIHTRVGDGYEGWPEAAPFDAIIVTCAPQKIPQPLVDQLKDGGRMVIPLGDRFTQSVWLVTKKDGKLTKRELKPTLFVPMTGTAQNEAAAKRAAEETVGPTLTVGHLAATADPQAR